MLLLVMCLYLCDFVILFISPKYILIINMYELKHKNQNKINFFLFASWVLYVFEQKLLNTFIGMKIEEKKTNK